MGATHQAHCECGFKTEVTVGGSRHTFNEDSQFPYHCASCGLVSVNIAKLTTGDKPPCPKCGGTDICQYGRPPVSIPFTEPPPPSEVQLAADQLAEWASKFGIKLPFGRVRPTGPKRPLRGWVTTVADNNRRALQCGIYRAFALDNLCPSCRKMTLIFEPMPSVMFD